MAKFKPPATEMGSVVWGIPANFNGFRVLAALLHGTPVFGVRTEGATYIRQGGHHVGHQPRRPSRWASAHILVIYETIIVAPKTLN